MPSKKRIAWFSDYAAQGEVCTLSAYFSSKLLALLSEQYQIELFSPNPQINSSVPHFHFLRAFEHHHAQPFDAFVYNLENHRSSYFVRTHLALMPGIVIFHDLLFTDFGPEPILNSAWKYTLQKFHDDNVPFWSYDLEHKQNGPIGFREASFAPVAVFTNERSHSEFSRQIAGGLLPIDQRQSYFLPYPIVSGPPVPSSRTGKLKIGFLGSPKIENRIHKMLLALKDNANQAALHWMVANEHEKSLALETLKEFPEVEVEFHTFSSPDSWFQLISTLDCAMHLHFSVFGQVEPYLGMSLMAGKPVLISDFGNSDYVPEGLVFKIAPGAFEAGQIVEVLKQIQTGNFPKAEVLNSYAIERHDANNIAGEMANVIEQSYPVLQKVMSDWRVLEAQAKKFVVGLQQAESSPFAAQFKELGWV